MLIEEGRWGQLTKTILDASFEVHTQLGPGLLESVYEEALAIEFVDREITFSRQQPIPVLYKNRLLGDFLRPDFMVSETVVVELKAVERLHPVHEAQLLTYLKLTGAPVGLLLNFHAVNLQTGIRRLLHPQYRVPRTPLSGER